MFINCDLLLVHYACSVVLINSVVKFVCMRQRYEKYFSCSVHVLIFPHLLQYKENYCNYSFVLRQVLKIWGWGSKCKKEGILLWFQLTVDRQWSLDTCLLLSCHLSFTWVLWQQQPFLWCMSRLGSSVFYFYLSSCIGVRDTGSTCL